MAEHGLSKVKACRAVGLSRSSYYQPGVESEDRDRPVIDALNKLTHDGASGSASIGYGWMVIGGITDECTGSTTQWASICYDGRNNVQRTAALESGADTALPVPAATRNEQNSSFGLCA